MWLYIFFISPEQWNISENSIKSLELWKIKLKAITCSSDVPRREFQGLFSLSLSLSLSITQTEKGLEIQHFLPCNPWVNKKNTHTSASINSTGLWNCMEDRNDVEFTTQPVFTYYLFAHLFKPSSFNCPSVCLPPSLMFSISPLLKPFARSVWPKWAGEGGREWLNAPEKKPKEWAQMEPSEWEAELKWFCIPWFWTLSVIYFLHNT